MLLATAVVAVASHLKVASSLHPAHWTLYTTADEGSCKVGLLSFLCTILSVYEQQQAVPTPVKSNNTTEVPGSSRVAATIHKSYSGLLLYC